MSRHDPLYDWTHEVTPDEATASGRVTRRASSDPACLLRVFLLAMAFGE